MTSPVTIPTASESLDTHEKIPQSPRGIPHRDKYVEAPEKVLALAVLNSAVKTIKNCPQTLVSTDIKAQKRAATRLRRALKAFYWTRNKEETFLFWCDVADIGADWLTERIMELAEGNSILMGAWEWDKAAPARRRAYSRRYARAHAHKAKANA